MNSKYRERPAPISVPHGTSAAPIFAMAGGQSDATDLMARFDQYHSETKAVAADVQAMKTEVEKYNKEIDLLNEKVAALTVGPAGGGGGRDSGPSESEKAAVRAFARSGRIEVQASAGGMSVDSSPDGGFTVPASVETSIRGITREQSPMRALATVRTITAPSLTLVVETAGLDAGWVGEREARPDTAGPKIGTLTFDAKEVYAMPRATASLLQDSAVDLADWLTTAVAERFSELEGLSFTLGDGVAQPRGFLNYPIATEEAFGKLQYVPSGAAETLGDDPVDALLGVTTALKTAFRPNAVWMANRKTGQFLRGLKDGIGRLLMEATNGGIAGAPAERLLGFPLVYNDAMPDIGPGSLPIAFGDFRRGYLIADRLGMRVIRDDVTDKPYIKFYCTKRVAGGVQDFQAIKLLRIAAT